MPFVESYGEAFTYERDTTVGGGGVCGEGSADCEGGLAIYCLRTAVPQFVLTPVLRNGPGMASSSREGMSS